MKDAEKVTAYMAKLNYPLKPEVEALRDIIKNLHPEIHERIKWNAPSYHFKGKDFLTFHLGRQQHVMLIFHHPDIVKIQSPLLQGDYKDRRIMYCEDMRAVEAYKSALEGIIKKQLDYITA